MTGHDFAAWCSKLIALDNAGTDDEMLDALRGFAAECGVALSDADIVAWFCLDELRGTTTGERT